MSQSSRTTIADAINLELLVGLCARDGYKTVLAEIRYLLIERALNVCGGNCTLAARMIRINRTTLVEGRRSLGLPLARAIKARVFS